MVGGGGCCSSPPDRDDHPGMDAESSEGKYGCRFKEGSQTPDENKSAGQQTSGWWLKGPAPP